MTNHNASVGLYYEKLFASEVQKDPNTIYDIVSSFSSDTPQRGLRIKIVETEGQFREKSDVFIRATGGHNFGANVKSFVKTGFNQVTRMTIDKFCEQFKMSNAFKKVIKKLTIEKATGESQNWITEKYIDMVVDEIRPKAYQIIRHSLLGDDSPKLFVLIKSDDKVIWIYKMEELLKYLENSIDVEVTPKGVLMLNECFSIQRKGGNGKHERYTKRELQHGGNNMQVKMKTGLLSSKLTPITTIYYNK